MRFCMMICLFSLHLSVVFAASLEKNATKRTADNAEEYKVLILGAGMAGIRAARTLYDAGIHNFLVLEGARDRIGGRLLLKNLPQGGAIEMGGNWVHGTENNPIWKLVQEAELGYYETMIKPEEGKYIVLGENGVDVTGYDGHKVMETADECLEELKGRARQDFSIRDVLPYCGWVPKNPAEVAIEYYYYDFEAAVSPKLISLGALLSAGGAEDDIDSTGGRQVLISDRRGYARIISNMAEKFKTKVRQNHVVEKIDWDKDVVTVKVKEKTIPMKADFVLVTFSVGVLQNQGASMFIPSLPAPFKTSLGKMKMANYLKIFMIFEQRFWPPDYDYIFYASKDRGLRLSIKDINI